MTKALKAIESHVDVILTEVTHLRTTAIMQATDSGEFLKLIDKLEDDEFILAKCPNYFSGEVDTHETITRYLLFIEGFGTLSWVYDHKEKANQND